MVAIRLSRATWLFLIVTIVVVVPTITFLAVPSEVDLWLIKHFQLPGLEESLGFKTGYLTPPPGSRVSFPLFAITSVTPDGVFWQAGVRPGDIPVGYHGGEGEFLFELSSARRTGSARFRLTQLASAASGEWNLRQVTVHLR